MCVRASAWGGHARTRRGGRIPQSWYVDLYRIPNFFHGFWDLNSRPHDCIESSLNCWAISSASQAILFSGVCLFVCFNVDIWEAFWDCKKSNWFIWVEKEEMKRTQKMLASAVSSTQSVNTTALEFRPFSWCFQQISTLEILRIQEASPEDFNLCLEGHALRSSNPEA